MDRKHKDIIDSLLDIASGKEPKPTRTLVYNPTTKSFESSNSKATKPDQLIKVTPDDAEMFLGKKQC